MTAGADDHGVQMLSNGHYCTAKTVVAVVLEGIYESLARYIAAACYVKVPEPPALDEHHLQYSIVNKL